MSVDYCLIVYNRREVFMTVSRNSAARAGLKLDELRAVLASDPPVEVIDNHVALQRVGQCAVVTLARPEQHNALSLAAWRQIAAFAEDLATDPQLRVVLVRGAGGNAFGAGADIAEFPKNRMTVRSATNYNDAVSRALSTLAAVPIPVVALIDGLAVGGGLELSSACDLRIATDRSRFGIPIGRLGVALGMVEATALSRLVGPAELKYLLFSGRLIDADRALRVGLVQAVVDSDRLIDEAIELVTAIATASLPTILAAKAVTDMTTRPGTARDTERVAQILVEVYEGRDLAEGVAAFLERRPPEFPSQHEGQSAVIGRS
jgi:enoyl-CoA hydratase